MPAHKYRVALLLALLVAGCSTTGINFPYKIDVQQGNVVTQDMVAKLKPGMTKSQVRYILGTPLITDAFHANRWDYVYRYVKAGKLTEERRITVIFEQDALQRIEGDVVAASPEKASPAPEAKPDAAPDKASPTPPEAAPDKAKPEQGASADSEEKGFFAKMLEKVGL
jgi:outer membrane protein assembly factor BamE